MIITFPLNFTNHILTCLMRIDTPDGSFDALICLLEAAFKKKDCELINELRALKYQRKITQDHIDFFSREDVGFIEMDGETNLRLTKKVYKPYGSLQCPVVPVRDLKVKNTRQKNLKMVMLQFAILNFCEYMKEKKYSSIPVRGLPVFIEQAYIYICWKYRRGDWSRQVSAFLNWTVKMGIFERAGPYTYIISDPAMVSVRDFINNQFIKRAKASQRAVRRHKKKVGCDWTTAYE